MVEQKRESVSPSKSWTHGEIHCKENKCGEQKDNLSREIKTFYKGESRISNRRCILFQEHTWFCIIWEYSRKNIFLLYEKMTISQEQLQKIAQKLSKIPASNEKLLWNIQDILWYMDLLQELDTTGIVPTVSVVQGAAELRKDSPREHSHIKPQDLLDCSPQKVIAGTIVLPNIMH